jgi:predicted acetyltransferase
VTRRNTYRVGLDIYFKMPEDPAYNYQETEVEDDLLRFLQCVEMVLTTRRGDVLGEPSFGANLEDYLWSPRSSSEQVAQAVRSQVETYCYEFTGDIGYGIQVSFVEGEVADTMIVDITVDGTKVLGIGVRP